MTGLARVSYEDSTDSLRRTAFRSSGAERHRRMPLVPLILLWWRRMQLRARQGGSAVKQGAGGAQLVQSEQEGGEGEPQVQNVSGGAAEGAAAKLVPPESNRERLFATPLRLFLTLLAHESFLSPLRYLSIPPNGEICISSVIANCGGSH